MQFYLLMSKVLHSFEAERLIFLRLWTQILADVQQTRAEQRCPGRRSLLKVCNNSSKGSDAAMPPMKLKCADFFQPRPSPVNPPPAHAIHPPGVLRGGNENHALRTQHARGEPLSARFYFTGRDFENWKPMYHMHTDIKSQRVQEMCTWMIEHTTTHTHKQRGFGCSCVFRSLIVWFRGIEEAAWPFKDRVINPRHHTGSCEINSMLYKHLETHYYSNDTSWLKTSSWQLSSSPTVSRQQL